MINLTSRDFVEALKQLQSDEERRKISRFYKGSTVDNKIIGVRMRDTFALAKSYQAMPLAEVASLLDSPYYEARMGAVSILDFKARDKKLPHNERKELFDLYIAKHDRINDWGLVDRAAPFVIGRYLIDKPRDVLYALAKSPDPWQRRTAITATLYFVRYGTPDDVQDVLELAGVLVDDPDVFVNKSVGIALKYVTHINKAALLQFLDSHAASMPAATFGYAVEKLDATEKARYKQMRANVKG